MKDKKEMLISFNNVIDLLNDKRMELLQEIALEEVTVIDEGNIKWNQKSSNWKKYKLYKIL